MDSAWSHDDALEKAARAKATSPTQWFVADNLADHTRFFVIQGSETLDHWCVANAPAALLVCMGAAT